MIVAPHNKRTFVERLDFRTTVGFGDGPGGTAASGSGFRGAGPTAVITDLGVLEPDPETKELVLTELHPGRRAGPGPRGDRLGAAGSPTQLRTTSRRPPRSSRRCGTLSSR